MMFLCIFSRKCFSFLGFAFCLDQWHVIKWRTRCAIKAPRPRASSRCARPPPQLFLRMAPLPAMIYGTAWKRARTRELVVAAVQAGFRVGSTSFLSMRPPVILTSSMLRWLRFAVIYASIE